MNTSIAAGKNASLSIPAGFMECIQEQCGKVIVAPVWVSGREGQGNDRDYYTYAESMMLSY